MHSSPGPPDINLGTQSYPSSGSVGIQSNFEDILNAQIYDHEGHVTSRADGTAAVDVYSNDERSDAPDTLLSTSRETSHDTDQSISQNTHSHGTDNDIRDTPYIDHEKKNNSDRAHAQKNSNAQASYSARAVKSQTAVVNKERINNILHNNDGQHAFTHLESLEYIDGQENIDIQKTRARASRQSSLSKKAEIGNVYQTLIAHDSVPALGQHKISSNALKNEGAPVEKVAKTSIKHNGISASAVQKGNNKSLHNVATSTLERNNAHEESSIGDRLRIDIIDKRIMDDKLPPLRLSEKAISSKTFEEELRNFMTEGGKDAILRHARLVIKGDSNHEVRLLLKPPELGVMRVKFQFQQNVLEGKFIVDNQLTKEIIERNLFDIQRHLREQGIESQGLEVSVNTNSRHTLGANGTQEQHRFHQTSRPIETAMFEDSRLEIISKIYETSLINLMV